MRNVKNGVAILGFTRPESQIWPILNRVKDGIFKYLNTLAQWILPSEFNWDISFALKPWELQKWTWAILGFRAPNAKSDRYLNFWIEWRIGFLSILTLLHNEFCPLSTAQTLVLPLNHVKCLKWWVSILGFTPRVPDLTDIWTEWRIGFLSILNTLAQWFCPLSPTKALVLQFNYEKRSDSGHYGFHRKSDCHLIDFNTYFFIRRWATTWGEAVGQKRQVWTCAHILFWHQ